MKHLKKHCLDTIMRVNHVLILAAGKGTRMGEIGKYVPKVLWPLGNKTILEHEIEYAKKLAPTANIYINSFFYNDELKKFYESSAIQAKLVEEKIELDIGGAVHNLASKLGYEGNLLIINSDQFLFFKKEFFAQAVEKLEQNDSVLFCHKVEKSEGYNQLDHVDYKFKSVIPNKKTLESEFYTYTGMSLIKLSSLKKVNGKSRFFDTVANGDQNSVALFPLNNYEYWDFGTLCLYHKSLYKLFEKKNSLFYQFLLSSGTNLEEYCEKERFRFDEFLIEKNKVNFKDIAVSV